MAYNTHYYSTDGGGDYKAFLDHFKKQAEGRDKPLMFNTRVNCTVFKKAKAGRGHLVLVNTRKSDGTTKNGERTNKLEVVDPNEAERRHALSEAVREEVEVTKEAEKEKDEGEADVEEADTDEDNEEESGVEEESEEVIDEEE